MADNDEAVDQPEETQEQQEQVAEPEQTQEESQAPEQTEQTETEAPKDSNEGADAPEPADDEELPEDPDFDPVSQYAGLNQQPNYQLPVGEDGSIDPVAFAQQIQQQTLAQVRFEQQEARAWSAIDKKWGEQLTPTRRQMILNARIANAIEGKEANLRKVADNIMREFNTSKSEGRAEATTSRKVQKAASLETATANRGEDRQSDLVDRIADGDKSAATSLFDQWLADGKI